MVVLDTNVISELMRDEPAAPVERWTRTLPLSLMYTTIMCRAEVLYGIAALDAGRKKAQLVRAAQRVFEEMFERRVLPFDERAATAFAEIHAAKRRVGTPMQVMDALIAGTVRANGFRLATRDTNDFADCGFDVIDPWLS